MRFILVQIRIESCIVNDQSPASHQLRSYFGPGAPQSREPCVGNESPMRASIGFTPRWFHRYCDVEFSERWHTDVIYRARSLERMREELRRRFPSIPLRGTEPDAPPCTIDGIFGAAVVPALFGMRILYAQDQWPAVAPEPLDGRDLDALAVPELSSGPLVSSILEQMDAIAENWGEIHGYLNYQGVLNTAFRLRGEAIFLDVMDEPERARRLFGVITETMIQLARLVHERQRASGVEVRHLSTSNCVVNMVSPKVYEHQLLPFDLCLREAFELFGVHNCAWNVDPYIEAYATIPRLGYVDMGLDSDLARVKRLCPNARRAVMFTPAELNEKPLKLLHGDLSRIHTELAPCDVVLADVDVETPDERVHSIHRMCEELAAMERPTGE